MIYGVEGTLWAVGFDLDRLEALGDPAPVQEGVLTKDSGSAEFGVSKTGSLMYLPGGSGSSRTLVWVDGNGEEEPIGMTPRAYNSPQLSPDGRHVVVDAEGPNGDLFLYDLETQVEEQFTFDPSADRWPLASDELAGRVLELLADPERAHRMGAAGRRLMEERFGEERHLDEVKCLYRESRRNCPPVNRVNRVDSVN